MNGIPKGLCSFGGVQRQRLWQGSGQRPEYDRRLAKGESKNSPVDCFLRGNAEDVVPYRKERIFFRRGYCKWSEDVV